MKGLGLGIDKLKFKASGEAVVNPFATAALAYDTKDLNISGINAVNLRRTGGATPTEDFFTFSEIANGTAETWVGVGNDGVVVDYIKQTSTGINFKQTVSLSQPKLIENGILVDPDKYILFDGVDDRMFLENTVYNFVDNTDFTLMFSFYSIDITNQQIILSDYSDDFNVIKIFARINNNKLNYAFGNNGNIEQISSINNLVNNQKYHAILKYKDNSKVEMYLNNVFQGDFNLTNSPVNNNRIDLGCRRSGVGVFTNHYNGGIRSILFFNGQTSRSLDTEIFNNL